RAKNSPFSEILSQHLLYQRPFQRQRDSFKILCRQKTAAAAVWMDQNPSSLRKLHRAILNAHRQAALFHRQGYYFPPLRLTDSFFILFHGKTDVPGNPEQLTNPKIVGCHGSVIFKWD